MKKMYYGFCCMFLIGILPLSCVSQESKSEKLDQGKRILKAMSENLQQSKQFSFESQVTVDQVLETGQKIQMHRSMKAYLARPNKIKASINTELGEMEFLYDGKRIYIYNQDQEFYAVAEAPNAIDEALDFTIEELDIAIPVSDLLFSDPYNSMSQFLNSSEYLGLTDILGFRCHHLAFTQDSIDWQIWIEDGEQLVPRKLVIDYKNEYGRPQYEVFFKKWNLNPNLSFLLFEFNPSPEAVETTFLTAKEEE